MKKVLFAALLLMGSYQILAHDGHDGNDPPAGQKCQDDGGACDYRTVIIYRIYDGEGNIMNEVTDDLRWPQSQMDAVKHKYALFSIVYSRDPDGTIRVQQAADAATGRD